MNIVIALAAALASTPLQNPSVYDEWREESVRIGVLATAVENCSRFGYDKDNASANRYVAAAEGNALMSGMDQLRVESIVVGAITEEVARVERWETVLSNRTSYEDLRNDTVAFFDFWEARCADASGWYPLAVIASGDEAAVSQQFREKTLADLEAAPRAERLPPPKDL